MLLNVVGCLEISSLTPMNRLAVQEASKRWVKVPGCHRKASVAGISTAFTSTAIAWLRFHHALAIDAPPIPPYGNVLPEYIRFVADAKSMTPATVRGYTSIASRFLRWAINRHEYFENLGSTDILDYIASLSLAGMKPGYITSVCRTLRSLFGFTESRGWTPSLISTGIHFRNPPRSDPNPKGPAWSEVRRMLSARTSNKPSDLRANAVLLFFAIYGLRSVEVSSLLLSDIDWTEETFTVRRAKGGRTQRFPISSEVAFALNNYLVTGRPKSECPNFFVTLRPPFRSTAHASLRCIVANRMRRLRIKSPLYSTHALRHSCATELLDKDVPMNEIAHFLGHQNNRSVGIYAKSSKASLRQVADFSLSGLR
ncbi:tyrosine-type recombinase/integrase [Granulicella paludicola]|uniref:tyrosine-type recombinase/integrase n=1 Tax=Granulicella paludicola TaxID=474951 RepID=UPI0037BE8165